MKMLLDMEDGSYICLTQDLEKKIEMRKSNIKWLRKKKKINKIK